MYEAVTIPDAGPDAGRGADISRVINIGIVMNVAMVVAKIAVGYLFNSIALVADGVHSLSDLATDVLAIVGIRIGERPPDPNHPYGHGKMETASALGIGAALVLVGGRITWVAGSEMYLRHHAFPGGWVFAIALVSVVGKEVLYRMTRSVAVRHNSAALYANAWHHRSDALGAYAVVCGVIGGWLGWGHADQVAGVAVGFMVVAVGMKIGRDAFLELTESSDPAASAKLRAILDGQPEVRDFHRLRSRRIGQESFLDVHILVDPALSVEQAHAISERVEQAMRARLRRPANVLVHIEPDVPAMRRIDPAKGKAAE